MIRNKYVAKSKKGPRLFLTNHIPLIKVKSKLQSSRHYRQYPSIPWGLVVWGTIGI
jgi:hypothetical protein